MERRLAVAAALVHHRWRRFDDRLQLVVQTEHGGGPHGDTRTSLDERPRLLERQIVLEYAEAAGPPCGARVDVGSVPEQYIHERQVLLRLMNGWRIEVEAWFVDSRTHVRMRCKQIARTF